MAQSRKTRTPRQLVQDFSDLYCRARLALSQSRSNGSCLGHQRLGVRPPSRWWPWSHFTGSVPMVTATDCCQAVSVQNRDEQRKRRGHEWLGLPHRQRATGTLIQPNRSSRRASQQLATPTRYRSMRWRLALATNGFFEDSPISPRLRCMKTAETTWVSGCPIPQKAFTSQKMLVFPGRRVAADSGIASEARFPGIFSFTIRVLYFGDTVTKPFGASGTMRDHRRAVRHGLQSHG
jgi:hypothetical protein